MCPAYSLGDPTTWSSNMGTRAAYGLVGGGGISVDLIRAYWLSVAREPCGILAIHIPREAPSSMAGLPS